MSDTIPARLFEFHEGSSDKFWEITLDETAHTVRYGRAGTDGQSKIKDFPTVEKAKASYDKLIKQKAAKGYVEVQNKADARTEKLKAGKAQSKEHEPFIQGILEHPDDVASYGVYADWLEEQGDPRGDFINTQLRLEDESVKAADRKKLQAAEKTLLKENARNWVGEELAPYLIDNKDVSRIDWVKGKIQTYEFARGFLDSITVRHLLPEFAKALRQSPHAATLRKLNIEQVMSASELQDMDEYADREFDEDGENPSFQAMRGASFPNLRSFICNTEGYGTGVDIHKLLKKMPNLEELELEPRDIDLDELFKLKLPQLKSLMVYHQYDYPIDVLAKNQSMANLEQIDFFPHAFDFDSDESYISAADMTAICRSKVMTKLQRLSLQSTEIGNEGLKEIVESGLINQLVLLNLHYGCITDEGAELLLKADLSGLQILDLGGNYLSAKMVKALKATGVNLQSSEMFTGVPDDERQHLYYGDME
jgi:uncharacterized protein (TIGR02996 family)